jgi:hypothetical protein
MRGFFPTVPTIWGIHQVFGALAPVSIVWIIAAWIGLSIVVALFAALFMRGGGSGGHHAGPALDPLTTRRRTKRQQDQSPSA